MSPGSSAGGEPEGRVGRPESFRLLKKEPTEAPGSASARDLMRRRRGFEWAGIWFALLLFAGIFVLRTVVPDSDHQIALLYAIPVLILAIELGAIAGIGAALLAVTLGAGWDVLINDGDPSPLPEYVLRGAIVVLLGASVGALASRLRASFDAQARFWDLSTDLLATADPSGYLTRVSPSWTRQLGWTPEQLTSRPFVEFVHPDDRASTLAELERVVTRGEGTDYQNRYMRSDGDYRTVQWRATADPVTGTIFAAARDITERVQAQQELQEAVERANLASEAKSEFLSRMSHELRTPLNAILGFTQLLELAELEEQDREAVTHIREAGDHLLRLVNELLEISVIETGHINVSLEPVAGGAVLDEVLALIEPLASDAGVALRRQPSERELTVLADRQRLSQVLINLVSNAVKYNQPGGTVTVACELTGPARAQFVVTDDGPGMDETQIHAVFTPFERLGGERTRVEGTGLGLPLAKRLVELMGGTLEPESAPGEGTTMRVGLAVAAGSRPRMPAPPDPSAPEAIPPAEAWAWTRAPRTVLYVEDDDASTELIQRALEHGGGIRLISAVSGERGLVLAREHEPDIVLLDFDLPDMNGLEILRRLKGDPATADMPVIVISAATTEGQAELLLEEGAEAFLAKPVEIARLLELTLQADAGEGEGKGERQPGHL